MSRKLWRENSRARQSKYFTSEKGHPPTHPSIHHSSTQNSPTHSYIHPPSTHKFCIPHPSTNNLFLYPPISSSIHLPLHHLLVDLSIHPSIPPPTLSFHPSAKFSAPASTHTPSSPIYPCIYPHTMSLIWLWIHPLIDPPVHPSFFAPIYQPVHPLIDPPIYPSTQSPIFTSTHQPTHPSIHPFSTHPYVCSVFTHLFVTGPTAVVFLWERSRDFGLTSHSSIKKCFQTYCTCICKQTLIMHS